MGDPVVYQKPVPSIGAFNLNKTFVSEVLSNAAEIIKNSAPEKMHSCAILKNDLKDFSYSSSKKVDF